MTEQELYNEYRKSDCKSFTDFLINKIAELKKTYRKQRNKRIDELQKENAELKSENQKWKDGAEFGYNKANEWHYVKDGDLPKETNEYYVYSKQWGVEVRKFFADVGYFECRKDIVIAWKEIVLPELKGE